MRYFSLLLQNRVFILLAFLGVHIALIWSGIHGPGTPMSDIPNAYLPWADFIAKTHIFLGLNRSWVYPFPDLIFILAPFGFPSLDYQSAWLTMAISIDLVAMATLVFWGKNMLRRRILSAWVWILGLGLIGPAGVSRLDTISIAVAVVGLAAWVNLKPDVAAVWFALATWIKVWPVALLGAAWAAAKERRSVLIYGFGTGLLVLIVGLLLGDPRSVLGFAFEQSDRGIQIESPWAAWWLWQGINKIEGAGLYYDSALSTFQVQGAGTAIIATFLGPVMYGALAITMALAWLAQRRFAASNIAVSSWAPQVLAWTSLTGVLDLIVFNKVGSPQYYGWLILPALMFGIYRLQVWRTVIAWILSLLALTGIVYPVIYFAILDSDPSATALLGFRNLLAIGLLVLANLRLSALGKDKALIVE